MDKERIEYIRDKMVLQNSYLQGVTFKKKEIELNNKVVMEQNAVNIGLGISESDDTLLAYKVNYRFAQLDEKDVEVTSMELEYEFVFKVEDFRDELIEYLPEDAQNTMYLVKYMNGMVYPYVKEYIESTYKKARIDIELPSELKIKEE